jgi:protein TonB
MPGTTNSAQNAGGLSERRAQPRTAVNPPIYVDIENVNGGLVYNMTEDGIAMSAAKALRGDGPLSLRIQLGGAGGWIETIGEIIWKSGSAKTAGLKFIGLPAEARQLIQDWLALERSKAESQPEGQLLSGSGQPAAGDARARSPVLSLPSPVPPSLDEWIPQGRDNAADGNASNPIYERRVHARHQIAPWSHVEVGPNNGGMLLNISESGLALIVAMRLAKNDFPTIRIQFADAIDPIEVCGQIVWLSESKREAGVRFVSLTEESRKNIALRISRAVSSGKAQEKIYEIPETRVTPPEMPELPEPAIAMGLPAKFTRKTEFKSQLLPAISPAGSSATAIKHSGLPAVLTLAAVIVLGIAGMATLPTVRTEMGGYIARSTANPDKPNEKKHPLSTGEAPEIRPPQAENSNSRAQESVRVLMDGHARGAETRVTAALPMERSRERFAGRPAITKIVHQPQSPLPANPTATRPESIATTQTKPSVQSSASQVVANPPERPPNEAAPSTAPNSPTNVSSGTAVAAMKQIESPPNPSAPPVAPATPTWSVAVSTDPYPSIRASGNTSSQNASLGKNLRVGHAISRVEPVYPEDAKRQGMEGAVKLHVIVSREGEVKKVELASGPALLAKAATRAIREWRYSLTLVGGQPVETEQDVVVTFRLVSR